MTSVPIIDSKIEWTSAAAKRLYDEIAVTIAIAIAYEPDAMTATEASRFRCSNDSYVEALTKMAADLYARHTRPVMIVRKGD